MLFLYGYQSGGVIGEVKLVALSRQLGVKGTRSNDRETRPKGGANMCSGGGLSSIRSFVKPVALN